jgi:hypothetical protein
MGTQGVKWEKDDFTICEAIKKHRGKLTHIAKDASINCSYQTLKDRVDSDPVLTQLVSDYRNHWVEGGLDKAEDVLMTLMDKVDEDKNAALKSAMFFLNNLGKSRGYACPEEKAADRMIQINNIERPYHKSDRDPA